jgi:hypothetical protein
MANSVYKGYQGTWWPLGVIVVATPGTLVNVMVNVDPSNVDAPESATSATSREYTVTCQEIFFQGYHAGAAPPALAVNTGNINIKTKPLAGAGGVGDTGCIVLIIPSGQSATLTAAALNRNVFSPYEIYVDADTAADGVLATLKGQ